ncbi:MAG TPA: class I SAM-dependent methyltransferase [Actinomycetota bacterium]|nr:class I SAM-dependent methyltransferase [Actinomycetota bacterium]
MDWWEGFFELGAWQGVQLGWDSLEDAEQQVDLIERALRVEPAARILDVPCGTGRVGRRLVERGYDVVGVDITERFLEEAREAGLTVEHADMRELRFEEEFDAAICMWGSFGYFDDAGNLAQARAAARALKPGGRYLIDTPALESIYPRFRDRTWFDAGDTLVLNETRFVLDEGRVETDWTFVRGAERETFRSSIRVYTLAALTDLLREAGFTAFEARDDELEPFELGSSRLWLVATR